MRPTIFFHPQLRSAALPRWIRRDINKLFVRCKTTQNFVRAVKETSAPKQPLTAPPRSVPSPISHAKATLRRGPPERILIYHGGTGKTIFLGMLRITTIFVFGVACMVVAPAFFASEFPSWLAPAIVVGGALPLLFVAYTSAPFVNYIHLTLPVFARKSREQALQYAKNLPPNATFYINTMKFTTIPRQTEVRLLDLVPDKALVRPVSFRNQNPTPLPWWQGRTLTRFYTFEKSKPARGTSTFYPELWEYVHKQIQSNVPGRQRSQVYDTRSKWTSQTS